MVSSHRFWETDDEDSPYFVVGGVMRSLGPGEEESDEGSVSDDGMGQGRGAGAGAGGVSGGVSMSAPGDVLYDTLYRYLVLFTTPSHTDTHPLDSSTHPTSHHTAHSASHSDSHDDLQGLGGLGGLGGDTWSDWYQGNPLWQATMEALGAPIAPPTQPAKRTHTRGKQHLRDKAAREECVGRFLLDQSQWALHSGLNPVVVNARMRLRALGGDGARRLMDRLVHMDPARRYHTDDIAG